MVMARLTPYLMGTRHAREHQAGTNAVAEQRGARQRRRTAT